MKKIETMDKKLKNSFKKMIMTLKNTSKLILY